MMFDHLDDPRPFEPDDRFRARVRRRGRSLQRRRRVATSSVGLCVVAGLLGGGWLYVDRRDAAIDRVEIATQPSIDGATNVLLVGLDRRPGTVREWADALMLVRVEVDSSVRVLSLPRDLWVDGENQRLGATRQTGMQTLLDAVNAATGLPVDHYVEIDLAGFAELVDAVGGVKVTVNDRFRDRALGLELAPSSCTQVDGATAVALARSRSLERLDSSGRWRSDPTADLGRIARAQALAEVALVAVADLGPDPMAVDRLSRALADHATLDAGLTLDRLLRLGRAVAVAGSDRTTFETAPVDALVLPDGAAVLRLADGATALLARYGSEPTDVPAAANAPPSGEPAAWAGDPFVPFRPC